MPPVLRTQLAVNNLVSCEGALRCNDAATVQYRIVLHPEFGTSADSNTRS